MDDQEIQRINDELARKFTKIEAELVTCQTVTELFETLLESIAREFSIPFVWLTLLRLPETEELRKRLAASVPLRDRLADLSPEAFREIVPDGTTPILASGDLRPYFRLLPPNHKYLLRSLAVSPLTLGERPIGSLNQGDFAPGRYEPEMETSRLRHLARLASCRLTELAPLSHPTPSM